MNIIFSASNIYKTLEKGFLYENKLYWILYLSRTYKIKGKDNKKMLKKLKSKEPIRIIE